MATPADAIGQVAREFERARARRLDAIIRSAIAAGFIKLEHWKRGRPQTIAISPAGMDHIRMHWTSFVRSYHRGMR
jgi:hypothetical protein